MSIEMLQEAQETWGQLPQDELMTKARTKLGEIDAELIRTVHMDAADRHIYDVAIASGGRVLGEGTTGVGKSHTAKMIARIIGGTYKRIQCTPDLTSDDFTGVSVWNPGAQDFDFYPGPIFADIALIDEINRATPKAQAGALEAMGEGQVTAPSQPTRYLPEGSIILATENPDEELEGTNPLPNASKDRFNVSVKYRSLTAQDNLAIDALKGREPRQVITVEEKPFLKKAIQKVEADHAVRMRTSAFINETLPEAVLPGIENRIFNGAQSQLGGHRAYSEAINYAKGLALMEDQASISNDHVDRVLPYVLRHRASLSYEAMLEGITVEQVIAGAIRHMKNTYRG